MHYREQVRKSYNEAVSLHPTADADLKQALRSNERVPRFIDNLSLELGKLAEIRAKRNKQPIDEVHIKEIVYEMTDTFIKGLIGNATRLRESDLARIAREDQEAKQREIELASQGQMTGDFKDMGLQEIQEDRST